MARSENEPVTILLSSFEGGRHIGEQIESIRAQSYSRWRLVCRDDGSTDDTVAIVRAAAADDDRIRLVEDGDHLGPAASFFRLLDQVDDSRFAFCDQDDIWEPHKLAWSMAELDRAAASIAAVFTDALIADGDGRVVGGSAFADRGLGGSPTFGELLMINAAIGATIVGTAALAEAIRVNEQPDTMHDWWVAVVAAYAGELRMLDAPTMRWRRHEATATGGAGGDGSIGTAARRAYVEWSSATAQRLLNSDLPPVASSASRQLATVRDLGGEGFGLRSVAAADRAGARPWPTRRRLALWAAALPPN